MNIYAFELQDLSRSIPVSYWDEERVAEAFEKRGENAANQPRLQYFVIRRYELNNATGFPVDVLKVNLDMGKIVFASDDPVLETFDWEKLGFADPTKPVVAAPHTLNFT